MNEMMDEVTGDKKDSKTPQKKESRGSTLMMDLSKHRRNLIAQKLSKRQRDE